jgi:hypothetical protein
VEKRFAIRGKRSGASKGEDVDHFSTLENVQKVGKEVERQKRSKSEQSANDATSKKKSKPNLQTMGPIGSIKVKAETGYKNQ